MIEFSNVLCATDLSEASLRPLTYAAAFARWYEARLTVLHVVPTFEPMTVRSESIGAPVQIVVPVSRDEVLRELRRAIAAAGVELLDPGLDTQEGDPARVIVDRALALRADLLVVGTHGRSGFERLLIGSVAEKVLRKASCPVLTVPPHVTATAPAEVLFQKVLCPVDFSPASLQAFGLALDLARQSNGSVTVANVLEWLPDEEPRAQAHFNVPEYRRYLIEDARQRLQALVEAEPDRPRDVETTVAVGRAYREVLRLSEELGADLIVMGSQGRGGLGLTLFGSTTQHVVRAAACPVLTARATPRLG